MIEQCCVACVRPVTYMNNSGIAVEETLGILQRSPADLLIVADDVALPLGTLRIRLRGSDGGHNGIASIIYQLGTEEFPRLRCGICPEAVPRGSELVDFVLSPFLREEEEAARTMVERAVDAIDTAARLGMEAAMNSYNGNTV